MGRNQNNKNKLRELLKTKQGQEFKDMVLNSKNEVERKEIKRDENGDWIVTLRISGFHNDNDLDKAISKLERTLDQFHKISKESLLQCEINSIKVVNRHDYTFLVYYLLTEIMMMQAIEMMESSIDKRNKKNKEIPYLRQCLKIFKMNFGYLTRFNEGHINEYENVFGQNYTRLMADIIDGFCDIFKYAGDLKSSSELFKRIGKDLPYNAREDYCPEAMKMVLNILTDETEVCWNHKAEGYVIDQSIMKYLKDNCKIALGEEL